VAFVRTCTEKSDNVATLAVFEIDNIENLLGNGLESLLERSSQLTLKFSVTDKVQARED
jgi:hypothetical protein